MCCLIFAEDYAGDTLKSFKRPADNAMPYFIYGACLNPVKMLP